MHAAPCGVVSRRVRVGIRGVPMNRRVDVDVWCFSGWRHSWAPQAMASAPTVRRAVLRPADDGEKNGVKKSLFLLFLATLPLLSMGLFLVYLRLIDLSRQIEIIAFTNILFAILLYLSDRKKSRRNISDISKRDILIIGIWQSFAVFPGTSRSGASITGARFLSYNRKDSIIISVILSIPSIAISSGYIALKFFNSESKIDFDLTIYATLFSFIFSYLVLKLFIRLGEAFSFTPYVIYRILLGLTLLTILYI